ncbi:hypothetical protein RCL1_005328 [Eukaryota sp. TZLM3-RCL]
MLAFADALDAAAKAFRERISLVVDPTRVSASAVQPQTTSSKKSEKRSSTPSEPPAPEIVIPKLVLDASKAEQWTTNELYWLRHALHTKSYSSPQAIWMYLKYVTFLLLTL